MKIRDYDLLNKLGQGAYGVVYKVKRKKDEKILVLKKINMRKMNYKSQKEAKNEVQILKSLNHPYIVQYYDSFIEDGSLHIIMEYCKRGDIGKKLKRAGGVGGLPENLVWSYFIKICLGLNYLHKRRILHRDIKTYNIFLTENDNIRIGDLGVAKVINDQSIFAHTIIGTPYYLSPELCEERPYNYKSDIWALGCVLYELCTKTQPFRAANQASLAIKIIRGRYDPIPVKYSKNLSFLIKDCLTKDYRKRPSTATILRKDYVVEKAQELGISLDSVALISRLQFDEDKHSGGVIKVARQKKRLDLIEKTNQNKGKNNKVNRFDQFRDKKAAEKSPKNLNSKKRKGKTKNEGQRKTHINPELEEYEYNLKQIREQKRRMEEERKKLHNNKSKKQILHEMRPQREKFTPVVARKSKRDEVLESPSAKPNPQNDKGGVKRGRSRQSLQSKPGGNSNRQQNQKKLPSKARSNNNPKGNNGKSKPRAMDLKQLESKNKAKKKIPFNMPPRIKEIGYFKPIAIKKQKKKINVIVSSKGKNKAKSRKKDIDLVKNLPDFGMDSSSEDDSETAPSKGQRHQRAQRPSPSPQRVQKQATSEQYKHGNITKDEFTENENRIRNQALNQRRLQADHSPLLSSPQRAKKDASDFAEGSPWRMLDKSSSMQKNSNSVDESDVLVKQMLQEEEYYATTDEEFSDEEIQIQESKLSPQEQNRREFERESKRERKLTKVLEKNVKYCEKTIGRTKLEELLKYLLTVVEAEREPQEEDIDKFEKENGGIFKNIKPQTVISIYKILHLRVVIKESRSKIQEILPKLKL